MPEHTIAENLQRLVDAKEDIADAITAKGGTVGANDGLEDFASDIATIPSSGGGVEFSNTPKAFDLMKNIRNLDVVIPEGCTSIYGYAYDVNYGAFSNCTGLNSVKIPLTVTSIGSSAFYGSGLKTIEIPSSVTTIARSAFDSSALEKIYIDKPQNSISDSPWGATNADIIWRTERFTSAVNEVSPGTTLTTSISCTIGDLVVATFVIRGNTYTIDSGWTLLGISEVVGNFNQRTAMAYKIAASSSESFTVTQDTAGRIYTNLVSITGASIGTFSGFTTQATGSSITLPKPQGLVIWGVSASIWGTSSPFSLWDISDKSDVTAIQLPTTTQPRCLTALDQSNNASETFTYSPDISGDAGLAAASLTITGIDNFWYYDD